MIDFFRKRSYDYFYNKEIAAIIPKQWTVTSSISLPYNILLYYFTIGTYYTKTMIKKDMYFKEYKNEKM